MFNEKVWDKDPRDILTTDTFFRYGEGAPRFVETKPMKRFGS